MIGQTVSHYKILEKLGEGGMGVVYKAQDLRLDRLVALKLLPRTLTQSADALARFQQEARAASALNHPNILTIYDFEEADGESFIAMELVDGSSVKSIIADNAAQGKSLPIDEVLQIALDVARGLAKAHEKGILHRDIKADNIMITHDGLAKVMDFGLAKLRGTSGMTRSGSTVGTLSYMSPEQMQGTDANERTDIYAFGVLLYEMVTGRLPFTGVHEAALMYEIVNVQATPLSSVRRSISPQLEQFVLKCLEKNPVNRYQSMADVVERLKQLHNDAATPDRGRSPHLPRSQHLQGWNRIRKSWLIFAVIIVTGLALVASLLLFGHKSGPIDSIAILPFENASGDSTLEYLSDGITESLINSLSQVSSLRVLPRGTVFMYKGQDNQAITIGSRLNVRSVLTGRVALREGNLNVQTDLIDVRKQSEIWGEQYNEKMADIFSLQDEMAKQIAKELRLQLSGTEEERMTKRYTENTQAYQVYLKGNYFIQEATPDDLAKGLDYMNQAIGLDPNFPLPYVGIAYYYGIVTDFYMAPSIAMPRMNDAVTKALELDNGLSLAQAWSGWYQLWYARDWSGAQEEIRRAIKLNPNEYIPHVLNSLYLATQDQMPQSIEEGRKAVRLQPLGAEEHSFLALTLYYAGRGNEAMAEVHQALDLDQNFPYAHLFLGMCNLKAGNNAAALASFQRANELFACPWSLAWVGYAYARNGQQAQALKVLETLKRESKTSYVASDMIASIYGALGDNDRAFEYLDKGYEEHAGWMSFMKVEPVWDPIRKDPRFAGVLKKMGLAR